MSVLQFIKNVFIEDVSSAKVRESSLTADPPVDHATAQRSIEAYFASLDDLGVQRSDLKNDIIASYLYAYAMFFGYVDLVLRLYEKWGHFVVPGVFRDHMIGAAFGCGLRIDEFRSNLEQPAFQTMIRGFHKHSLIQAVLTSGHAEAIQCIWNDVYFQASIVNHIDDLAGLLLHSIKTRNIDLFNAGLKYHSLFQDVIRAQPSSKSIINKHFKEMAWACTDCDTSEFAEALLQNPLGLQQAHAMMFESYVMRNQAIAEFLLKKDYINANNVRLTCIDAPHPECLLMAFRLFTMEFTLDELKDMFARAMNKMFYTSVYIMYKKFPEVHHYMQEWALQMIKPSKSTDKYMLAVCYMVGARVSRSVHADQAIQCLKGLPCLQALAVFDDKHIIREINSWVSIDLNRLWHFHLNTYAVRVSQEMKEDLVFPDTIIEDVKRRRAFKISLSFFTRKAKKTP